MGTPEPLTPAEWKVMRLVWERKQCAARDVYTNSDEWSPSTVKTILRRLVEKGHLSTTRVGNSFLYRPVRTALSSLRRAADSLLENTVDGTTGPLLAYIVRKSKLSADDLAELRSLLDAHQPIDED